MHVPSQTIIISNAGQIIIDQQMLNVCLLKCSSMLCNSSYEGANIIVSERLNSGWLEWAIMFSVFGKQAFYLGAIQRTPDAEYEFHS